MAEQKPIPPKNSGQRTLITIHEFINKISKEDGDFSGRIFGFKIDKTLLEQCGITDKIDFELNFYAAQFKENLLFSSIEFLKTVSFWHTEFLGIVSFRGAQFLEYAKFDDAKFLKFADFQAAEFSGFASFWTANFSDNVDFMYSKFLGVTLFINTTFKKEVSFNYANFSGNANFEETKFLGEAKFLKTDFSGDTNFEKAKFSKLAEFIESIFSKNANFEKAEFFGDANFEKTNFSREAYFWKVVFSKDANFEKTDFSRETNFGHATFLGPTYFIETIFSDTHTNFFHKLNENKAPPEIIFQTIIFSNKFILSESDLSKTRFEECIIEKLQFLNCKFKKEGKGEFDFTRDAFYFESKQNLTDKEQEYRKQLIYELRTFLCELKPNITKKELEEIKDREQLICKLETFLFESKQNLIEKEIKDREQLVYKLETFLFESKQNITYKKQLFCKLKIFLFESKQNITDKELKDREQLSRQMKASLEASKNWKQAGDFFIEEMESRLKQFSLPKFIIIFFIWAILAAFLSYLNLEISNSQNLTSVNPDIIQILIPIAIFSSLPFILITINTLYQTFQSWYLFLYKWLFGYAERILVIVFWMVTIFVITGLFFGFKDAAFLTILPLTFKAKLDDSILKAILLVISWVYWIMLGVAVRRKFRR